MGHFSHRQPAWTFSSVVLLSTLLLSPIAAAAVLRALSQNTTSLVLLDGPVPPEPPAPDSSSTPKTDPQRPRSAGAPRRSLEEESTHQAAAEEYTPENSPETGTELCGDIALLLPARTTIRVPDTLLPAFHAVEAAEPVTVYTVITTPPRAPPV